MLRSLLLIFRPSLMCTGGGVVSDSRRCAERLCRDRCWQSFPLPSLRGSGSGEVAFLHQASRGCGPALGVVEGDSNLTPLHTHHSHLVLCLLSTSAPSASSVSSLDMWIGRDGGFNSRELQCNIIVFRLLPLLPITLQLPFVVETCGGMGPSAVALLKAMARAAQEQLSMWPKWDIIRHVVGSVAVAVQRGTANSMIDRAMSYLQGYDRALSALAKPSKGKGRAEEQMEAEGHEASDSEEEAWGESGGEVAGDFE